MVSQLLFGERVEIIENYKSNWLKIRCLNDDYIGWMDPKQLVEVDQEGAPPAIALEMSQPIWCDGLSTYITIGAELPQYDGMTTKVAGHSYRYSGQAIQPDQINKSSIYLDKLVRKWLNSPYLWGGRSPFGVDCSGFTQVVFKCLGYPLLRDSSQQVEQGDVVDFIEQAQLGDLAFFSKDSDRITHVGIILEGQKVIHASGSVRIDTIDHYGIYNNEIEQYTHRMKIIKRPVDIIQESFI
jgi:cell wall-associated NlpC family hydrolase